MTLFVDSHERNPEVRPQAEQAGAMVRAILGAFVLPATFTLAHGEVDVLRVRPSSVWLRTDTAALAAALE